MEVQNDLIPRPTGANPTAVRLVGHNFLTGNCDNIEVKIIEHMRSVAIQTRSVAG
jgi:hypothetical protein